MQQCWRWKILESDFMKLRASDKNEWHRVGVIQGHINISTVLTTFYKYQHLPLFSLTLQRGILREGINKIKFQTMWWLGWWWREEMKRSQREQWKHQREDVTVTSSETVWTWCLSPRLESETWFLTRSTMVSSPVQTSDNSPLTDSHQYFKQFSQQIN